MPKIIPGDWSLELTPEQIEAIDWYIANPPIISFSINFIKKFSTKLFSFRL